MDDEYHDPFPPDIPLAELGLNFPTGYLLGKVIATYKWSTSIGGDHWPPRLLAFLDESLLDLLALIIRLMVLWARTPRHFHYLLIHLIPKASGGDRLIGVSPR